MDKTALLDMMIEILCRERGGTAPELEDGQKADFFRALCNVRPPMPVSAGFLRLQDEYLSEKTAERGVVDAENFSYRGDIALWRGDITRLKADAIVNACNSALLGCFHPLHNCIDNVIHSNAGVQVRLDCDGMMKGGSEPNGSVKVTKGYNLPCRYIFHTVGPVVRGKVTPQNEKDLKSCYLSCLDKAEEMGLKTLAFCCLSTGEYRYPKAEACKLAVSTVKNWKKKRNSALKVIFNVFQREDEALYEKELHSEN